MRGRITLNPIPHIDPLGTIILPLISLFFGGIIFGWAKPTPVDSRYFRKPRRDHMLTAAAGPVSNLLLASVFALLFHFTIRLIPEGIVLTRASGWTALLMIFRSGVLLNVVLAVFNFLPIYPLDGSWIAEGIMPRHWLPHWYQFKQYSMMFLLILFIIPGLFRITLLPFIQLFMRLYGVPF